MILLKVPILGDLVDLLANLMGYIMQFLFFITGGHNIGLCIILFTIIVRLLMLPMTIKQQRTSKLSSIMQPEIKAVQDKYKGKTDTLSMQKMQEETRAIYDKYGTSPTGGCLPMLIQLPIFYGIFAVVRNIPKYVPSVKALFTPIIDGISSTSDFSPKLIDSGINIAFTSKLDYTDTNALLEVFNTFSAEQWNQLKDIFPAAADTITNYSAQIMHINNFLGINLATAPGFSLSIALIIPILAGLTQWLSMKLMPNASGSDDNYDGNENSMAQSMKMMNNVMPIVSAVFCISMPSGLGLYWIMGSVVQCVIQIIANKEMSKIDIEELAKKNIEKANEKRAKKGLPPNKVDSAKSAIDKINDANRRREEEISRRGDRAKQIKDSTEYYNQNAKPGSLASKVNMVKLYNERNSGNNSSSKKEN